MFTCAVEVNRQATPLNQWLLILRDLIPLGQIRVKIVLSGKTAHTRNLPLHGQTRADGELRCLAIEHRQHPWHTETDRARLLIRVGLKHRRTGAKQFRFGEQLRVYLEANNTLVFHTGMSSSELVAIPSGLPDRQTASWGTHNMQTSYPGNFPGFVCCIWFDRKHTSICKVHFKIPVLVYFRCSNSLTKSGERRPQGCRPCRRQLILSARFLQNKVSFKADCRCTSIFPQFQSEGVVYKAACNRFSL